MMFEIDCEVLWLNEEQQNMQNADVKVDFKDCDSRMHTFYNIDFIRPSNYDGFAQVSSGGEDFVVREDYVKLKDRIKQRLILKFN